MKKITKFESDDGTEFWTEEDCRRHELITGVSQIFADLIKELKGCPFSNEQLLIMASKEIVEKWDVLRETMNRLQR